MENMKVIGTESAEGEVPTDYSTSIIKVACILIIGVAILTSVVTTVNVTSDSVFYGMYNSVIENIKSGYTLATLICLVIGSGAILHFLGFI
jgi:hypothetical protein